MWINKDVEIYVGEPWDAGILKASLVDEKNGVLMLFSEQPIKVKDVQTKRFYGKRRHIEDTGVYNFFFIEGVDEYSIDDIPEYEKGATKAQFFMIGSVKQV